MNHINIIGILQEKAIKMGVCADMFATNILFYSKEIKTVVHPWSLM